MQAFLKLLVCVVAALAGIAHGQSPQNDALRCRSATLRPGLDFDFRFVAGHWFSLPVKQFWEREVDLRVVMQVEPINGTPGEMKRVAHRLQATQPVPLGVSGEFNFPSAVSLGIGEYRSSWRISDRDGRSCQGTRVLKAKLSRKERGIDVTLKPGEIVDTAMHMFRNEEAIERPHLRSARRLKIFISLDVLGRRGRVARTRLVHILPHIAALRQLGRSQSFNQFSVVVFSFEDQRIVARQDYRPTIDFSPLTKMIQQLRPDAVDYRDLMRGSEMAFFGEMLAEELRLSEIPDGVVFIGHEMNFGKRLPSDVLAGYRELGIPVAFFDGSRFAWTGAMGKFVRAMDGREFALRRPSDLAKAISGFESRVQALRPQ